MAIKTYDSSGNGIGSTPQDSVFFPCRLQTSTSRGWFVVQVLRPTPLFKAKSATNEPNQELWSSYWKQALSSKVSDTHHLNLEILPHFISLIAARSTRILLERRITHILSVCDEPIPAEVPQSGISHKRISIEDVEYADLLIHLPIACQFIHQALTSGGIVLVHSVSGISRGAAVVVAYGKQLWLCWYTC